MSRNLHFAVFLSALLMSTSAEASSCGSFLGSGVYVECQLITDTPKSFRLKLTGSGTLDGSAVGNFPPPSVNWKVDPFAFTWLNTDGHDTIGFTFDFRHIIAPHGEPLNVVDLWFTDDGHLQFGKSIIKLNARDPHPPHEDVYGFTAYDKAGYNTFFGGSKITSWEAILYAEHTDAVPEPQAWAMMILGFGVAGLVLRRRRTHMTALDSLVT